MSEPLEEVYRPSRCWWTFKGRKFDTPQHTCANPATLYRVTKVTGDTLGAYMWLCDRHVSRMKSNNYIVTKVPVQPKQQPVL